jgi:phenylpropionate dioxygenase-like ring-hydroxylating dioxygenase large terminal subunit
LRLELDCIFRRGWICAGRQAEILNPGDYLCTEIASEPVVVIRQKDNSIKAFPNVCLHRSAQLLEGRGHVSRISCPYHSWTYGLDGQLIGAPAMQQTTGFNTADYKMKPLACELWQGFIYVSLHCGASPIVGQLADLEKIIGDFRMTDYVPVFEAHDTWDTNWKCLAENFMDVYHLQRVHADSFDKYGSSAEQTEFFPGGDAFAYHYVQDEPGPHSVRAASTNTWLEGDQRLRTYLINIFPGHVIQLQPDMLWYLSIQPKGVGKVSIRWAVSIPAEILGGSGDRQPMVDDVMSLLHQVNAEDRKIVESVFRATGSAEAAAGPLSHLERNCWDFGRYLSRKLTPT